MNSNETSVNVSTEPTPTNIDSDINDAATMVADIEDGLGMRRRFRHRSDLCSKDRQHRKGKRKMAKQSRRRNRQGQK